MVSSNVLRRPPQLALYVYDRTRHRTFTFFFAHNNIYGLMHFLCSRAHIRQLRISGVMFASRVRLCALMVFFCVYRLFVYAHKQDFSLTIYTFVHGVNISVYLYIYIQFRNLLFTAVAAAHSIYALYF